MTIKSFVAIALLGLLAAQTDAQTPVLYAGTDNPATLHVTSQRKKSKLRRLSRTTPVAPTTEQALLSPANVSAYIVSNLQYPPVTQTSKIEGVVQAKVIISPDGQVRDPEIIKGLGYGCDEAVLCLLADMPTWKPFSDRDQELIIPVRFVLR